MGNINNTNRSGTQTVGSTAAQIATGIDTYLNYGVRITVDSSASNGIFVYASGDTATGGDFLAIGESRFYPADKIKSVYVKRNGSVDVTVYWYAF